MFIILNYLAPNSAPLNYKISRPLFEKFSFTWWLLHRACGVVYCDAAANMTTALPVTTPASSSANFDVASFFGGIVLGAAVVALGLVAWKCYQHRRQANVPYSAMAQ